MSVDFRRIALVAFLDFVFGNVGEGGIHVGDGAFVCFGSHLSNKRPPYGVVFCAYVKTILHRLYFVGAIKHFLVSCPHSIKVFRMYIAEEFPHGCSVLFHNISVEVCHLLCLEVRTDDVVASHFKRRLHDVVGVDGFSQCMLQPVVHHPVDEQHEANDNQDPEYGEKQHGR